MLNFKDWLAETKQNRVINPDVKKWIDSADKLKQTIEKLKAILKSKKIDPEKVDIEELKPKPKPKEELKPKPKEELKKKDLKREKLK